MSNPDWRKYPGSWSKLSLRLFLRGLAKMKVLTAAITAAMLGLSGASWAL